MRKRPEAMSGIITLLTDFGTQEPYVGVMKGVILGIVRDATLVDLTHEVTPQSICEAAFLLDSAFRYFPEGTVHLAVVDPGVGSERRGVALTAHGHYFVAPDNGLLTEVLRDCDVFDAVYLEEERFFRHPVSSSFHGRDVFAPVAASMAAGTSLVAFGSPCHTPCRLNIPAPVYTMNKLTGQVIHMDRFGNLITNIQRQHMSSNPGLDSCVVQIGDITITGIAPYYSAVEPGTILATFTSFDRLEIAQREGHAAQTLHVGVGASVTVLSSRDD